MAGHDAIDSLIYVSRSVGLSLDGLADEIAERFGYSDENEDVAFLVSWIDSIQEISESEARSHFDGRGEYSTGVPFMRCYEYPTTEPGENGEIVLATGEAWVDMHPDGSPEEPLNEFGVWVNKERP